MASRASETTRKRKNKRGAGTGGHLEKFLQASPGGAEHSYPWLLDNLNDGVFVLDPEGRFRYANKAIEKRAGISAERFIGRNFLHFVQEEDRERIQELFGKAVKGKKVPPFQIQYSVPEGNSSWAEINVQPLCGCGPPCGMVGITRDISERKQCEEALRESEEQFRTVTEQSPNMIFINKMGKVVYANRLCQEVMGYSLEEFYSPDFDFMTLIAPESLGLVRSNFSRHLEGSDIEPYEYTLLTKEGRRIEAIITTKLVSIGRERVILGIVTDIGERKRTERALRESEARLGAVIESFPFDLFALDSDGRYVLQNSTCREHWGDIVGKRPEDVVMDEETLRLFQENNRRAFAGEIIRDEVELRHLKGRGFYLNRISPIRDGERTLGIVGVNVDITERRQAEEALRNAHAELEYHVEERTAQLAQANARLKLELFQRGKAEEALRKNEEKFRGLTELLPEVVFETDSELRLTYTNRIGFQKFGYTQKEFDRGLSGEVMVAPEERPRLRKNMARLMKGLKLGPGGYVAQDKAGSRFPVMIHSNVILDLEGNPVGLRGVMFDVTEQKRAEEKLMAHRERLSSLASELSLAEERIRRHTATELHDSIGQNMAFAKMKLGVLRNSGVDPSVSRTLDEILELLDETIGSTRVLISELSSPILYELGLSPALEWLVEQMQQRYGIDLAFEDDRRPKPLADHAKVLLFQAVRELIVNVTKHAGGKKAKVSASRNRERLHITVEDDGVGFNPSSIELRGYKTGGFGLFSIRTRLESIGGQIMIDSERGKGTRVTLVAPLTQE
jgi:PAS domain S-box-containing protein